MIFPWENFMKRSAIISTLSLITLSLPAIVIERAIATYFFIERRKFGNSIIIILLIAQNCSKYMEIEAIFCMFCKFSVESFN
ncbi:Antirepressor protein [Dirofilaria immitis]